MIAQHLQLLGMVSEYAASGREALRLLDASLGDGREFACIIAAADLPDMVPGELVGTMRKNERFHGIKFLSLTTLRRHVASPAEVALAGINAQVMKPLRLAHLRETLIQLFRSTRESTTEKRRNSGAFAAIKGRVLVAEDNGINQRLVVAMLARIGCHCDVVGNGLEAIQALAQAPYDVVLMDCLMPEMDGFQATVEIRAAEAAAGGRRIPDHRGDRECDERRPRRVPGRRHG